MQKVHRNIRTKSANHLWAFFLTLVVMIGPAPWAWSFEDAIIAVVNNELITLQDLRDYLNSVYIRLRLSGEHSEAEINQMVNDMPLDGLNKLIQDKLILDEADRQGLRIRDEAIDEKITNIKRQYPDQEAFMQSLTSEGYTLTDLRDKIRNQLKIQGLVDAEVRSQIKINPQEVTDYYHEHPEEFQRNERVNLDSIYIAKKADPTEARRQIEKAQAALEASADFRTAAEEYSQMPPIGIIAEGQLLPEIEKVVFHLRLNKISPIVETEEGYYLFKILGKVPAQRAPLEEVKNEISERLFQKKFQQKLSAWIEQLKNAAYIEIKD